MKPHRMRMTHNLLLHYDLYKDMEVRCCDDNGGLAVENHVFHDLDSPRVGVSTHARASR